MNFLRITLLVAALFSFTSCSHFSGKKGGCCDKKAEHSCCKDSKDCKDGNCKLDKSCCENKCGNCTGKKGDCGKNCELKSKKKCCKDKKNCDLKKAKTCKKCGAEKGSKACEKNCGLKI